MSIDLAVCNYEVCENKQNQLDIADSLKQKLEYLSFVMTKMLTYLIVSSICMIVSEFIQSYQFMIRTKL